MDLSTIGQIVDAVKRLAHINRKIQNAEFASVLADLNFETSKLRQQMSDFMDENTQLRDENRELNQPKESLCPSCSQPTWRLVKSESDKTFGVLGVNRRFYRCESCGFEESKIDHR